MTDGPGLAVSGAPRPEFLDGRCVHALLAQASCALCAGACPRGALSLDDDALGFDAVACDGCGLCVASCPQQAIALPVEEAAGPLREAERLYLAEAGWDAEARAAAGPSLNELGWEALLGLHAAGVRALLLPAPPEDRPPEEYVPAQGAREPPLWQRVNALLESRGLPPLTVRRVARAQWLAGAQAALAARDVAPRRRAFLRRLVEPVVEELATPAAPPLAALPEPPGAEPAVYPAVPLIDPLRCEGCDACTRVCPTGALVLDPEPSTPRYVLDPARCTGCGMCVDVCAPRALRLELWGRARAGVVELRQARCRACGLEHHAPSVRDDGLCPICARTGRHRLLYQVDP